jgi:hypothetical protein
MNPYLILIIVLTVGFGIVAARLAIIDARADREHRQAMRRTELRRRRTQVEVQGIRHGHRLDSRAGARETPERPGA